MSTVKILIAGLVSLTTVCSVMYYFTLYQDPPGPPMESTTPVIPTPTAAIKSTVTFTPTSVIPKTQKPQHIYPTPKPTRTPTLPKPRKEKPMVHQFFPFGKPKPTSQPTPTK
ncbi:MAG TPA: hypothetical protein VK791_06970 [bacterium]|jgi:hypothetical protein|nr:hypothetical protein [bacterium]